MKIWGISGNKGRWLRFVEGTSGIIELKMLRRWSEVANSASWWGARVVSTLGMSNWRAFPSVTYSIKLHWTLQDLCLKPSQETGTFWWPSTTIPSGARQRRLLTIVLKLHPGFWRTTSSADMEYPDSYSLTMVENGLQNSRWCARITKFSISALHLSGLNAMGWQSAWLKSSSMASLFLLQH